MCVFVCGWLAVFGYGCLILLIFLKFTALLFFQDKHWRLIGWGKIRRGTTIDVTAMSAQALDSSMQVGQTDADALDGMADSEAAPVAAAAATAAAAGGAASAGAAVDGDEDGDD